MKNILVNSNYRKAMIIAGLLMVWFFSGYIGGDKNQTVLASQSARSTDQSPSGLPEADDKTPLKKSSVEPQSVDNLTRVKARISEAESYQRKVTVNARSEANRQINIRSEIAGSIIALPVDKGETVNAGDVICELAPQDWPLRVREAEAAVELASIEYDGALLLKKDGYQSKLDIALARSRLESARANLKQSQLRVGYLKIKAPFDGVIESRPVEIGDFIDRGDTCATVLDLDPLVIAGRVSENDKSRIPKQGEVSAQLSSGEVVTGKVHFLGESPDESTRTFRIEAEVANPELTLGSGLTAQLDVFAEEVAAHKISPDLLALDDAGDVVLKILDQNHRVNKVKVVILGDHPEGVWVSGLPEKALLITQGQGYVAEGEKVAVTIEGQPLNHQPVVSSTNL